MTGGGPLAVTVAAYDAVAVLLTSVLVHARRPAQFGRTLARHGVWPEALLPAVMGAILLAEAVLALAGLVALVRADGGALVGATFAAMAALYASYALYGAYLAKTRPDVPCGCAGGDHATNGWVAGRAAVLAGAALVVALAPGRMLGPAASDEFLLTLFAGVSFAAILWTLPAAMDDPGARLQTARGGADA